MAAKSIIATLKDVVADFFSVTPHVVLGTGTSCAVDVGFGMGKLQEALLSGVDERALHKDSVRQWRHVKAELAKGKDLETALNAASTPELQQVILKVTYNTVAGYDQKYSAEICLGKVEWPAMAILKKIYKGLSAADDYGMSVITTNYDLLIEYACAANGIKCVDGFCGGVIRGRDWDAVQRGLKHPVEIFTGKKRQIKWESNRHVQLYKVHGSLNWFMLNGSVIENDIWVHSGVPGLERVMITPGLAKYRKMQDFRKELQSDTDKEVDRAKRFLFLGYGMNDAHIERYIVKRVEDEMLPTLIITRDLNVRVDKFACGNKCVMVFCGMKNPDNGTRVFCPQLGGWQEIPGKRLWDFSEFSKQLM